MNVLLVDDDPDIRLVAGAALRSGTTNTVREAEGVQDALAVLQTFRPDVIISDLRMPGSDGRTLLAAIRRDSAWAAIPVVILTAADDVASAGDLLAAGARAVIAKPFDPRTFAADVERLCRNS